MFYSTSCSCFVRVICAIINRYNVGIVGEYKVFSILGVLLVLIAASPVSAKCPYDYNCLDNPYGAGNPYSGEEFYVVSSE